MVSVALLGTNNIVKSLARGLQFLLRVFEMIFDAFCEVLNSVVVSPCILLLRTNVADLTTIAVVETLVATFVILVHVVD